MDGCLYLLVTATRLLYFSRTFAITNVVVFIPKDAVQDKEGEKKKTTFVIIFIVMTTNILKPRFLLCVHHDPWEHISDTSHGFTMGQASPIKLPF